MRKTYRYKNLSFPVDDETKVNFTVKFITDGNRGLTSIDVPDNLDPEIVNADTTFIGLGKDLRKEPTYCVSNIDNPIPEEDIIGVEYLINGVRLVKHENNKAESDRPVIILKINFTKP